MTGALLLVAFIVYVTTHNFRFMKPLPFICLDYLGCILWSAWMLEFIILLIGKPFTASKLFFQSIDGFHCIFVGTRFRQWANSILKQYIIKGYAINQKRLDNYNELI